MDSEHTSVKWLTNYSGGGKCFIGVNITKIDEDRFLVIWENYPEEESEDDAVSLTDSQDTLSSGDLHYVFVNGASDVISDEFTAPAMISDCHPVLNGSKIVYYASNANCLAFYTIDIYSSSFSKSVTRVAGDNVTWNYKNQTLSFSGTGSISLDLEGGCRFATSTTSSAYSYSSSDNCWQYIRDGVTTINIREGITAIPDNMFAWFDSLTDVKLPQSLKSIGNEAFYACGNLRKLTIPDSVNKIGNDILWTGSYWSSDDSHVVYATIYGNRISYGIKYAKNNGISSHVSHNRETSSTTIRATTKKNGKIGKKCRLCGNVSTEQKIYYPKTIQLSKKKFRLQC